MQFLTFVRPISVLPMYKLLFKYAQISSLLHQRYMDFTPCLIQGLLKALFSGNSGNDSDKNTTATKKRSTLKLLMELYFMGLNITSDQKRFLKKALCTYYDAATELLQSEHASIRVMESGNVKVLNTKGELSDENTGAYEKLRKIFDQLLCCISLLAEALDAQPPIMLEHVHTTRVITGTGLTPFEKDSSAAQPIWDDEDTMAFYEYLPDLRAFVPAVLLGEVDSKLVEQHGKVHEQSNCTLQPETAEDNGEISVSEHQLEGEANGKPNKEKEKAGKEIYEEKVVYRTGDTKRVKVRGIDGANLDSLLHKLPGCISHDLIDELKVELCFRHSKANREKLVQDLFSVPRTSLELLPCCSRLAATLSPFMKDLPSMLLLMFEEEFNFLINKKDQIKIETNIRNIRFTKELYKFKVVPSCLVFCCLKSCLDDFSHHNIDMACNLLETCGCFLYRSIPL